MLFSSYLANMFLVGLEIVNFENYLRYILWSEM